MIRDTGKPYQLPLSFISALFPYFSSLPNVAPSLSKFRVVYDTVAFGFVETGHPPVIDGIDYILRRANLYIPSRAVNNGCLKNAFAPSSSSMTRPCQILLR